MIGSKESFIPVSGGRVYCRQVGGACAPPLLVVHGGPGIPHQQLQPLEQLSVDRPVIFYDQLGCGKSDRPDCAHLWQTDRFVDELDEVRNNLASGAVHILGYSWGSMVAVDYALRKPAGHQKPGVGKSHTERCRVDEGPRETQRLFAQRGPIDPGPLRKG